MIYQQAKNERALKLLACLLLSLGLSMELQAQGCLTALTNEQASQFGMSGGYDINLESGSDQFWIWSEANQQWTLGGFRARATGVAQGNQQIDIWPDQWTSNPATSGFCDPVVLAEGFKYLTHELLHFVCPQHSDKGNVVPKDDGMPESPGQPPDCNDINYAQNTAKEICDEISEAEACLADQECPGLTDDDGNEIVSRDDLPAYIVALNAQHQSIQDKFNNEGTADAAFGCNCPSGWSAGPSYPDCPPSETPNDCTSQDSAYPNNEVVPDCPPE